MSKSGAKGKGLTKAKARRQTKNKSYYKGVQDRRTEKNKTKKVLRHFKSNPTCLETTAYLEAKGYNTDTIQRTSKGRKVEARG